MIKFIITLVLGFLFGVVLIASEAFSWYRIQEMFYFKSFHMYGLLFSAIGTAVRFEPGQSREVELVNYVGERKVYGFRGNIQGNLD